MRHASWPAAFAAMLALLLMAGSVWAGTDTIGEVVSLNAAPTPFPIRSYLPWIPNDGTPTPVPTPTPTPTPTATPIPAGWIGQYFNNTNLSGTPTLVRIDSQIDFDWGAGSPDPALQPGSFSVRWTRTMNFDAGNYNFFTYTEDGVRLWVDDNLVIDEWQTQQATQFLSALPLTAGLHTVKMEYFADSGRAVARLGLINTTDYPQPQQWEWGTWKGEYFDNPNLSGDPKLVRQDNNISFDWGDGSPDASIPADHFSARWTASLYLQSGNYDFFTYTDDGVRLYVDGNLVINQWQDELPTLYRSYLPLNAGVHFIRMEYYEDTGGAAAHLWWHNTTQYPQWRGEYYSNMNLSGSPTTIRSDTAINFNWSGPPASGVPQYGFSARWTGVLYLDAGTYTFTTYADDGVRLWVDESECLNQWQDQSQQFTSVLSLSSGVHFVRMEYYQDNYGAIARLNVTKN